MDKLNRRRSAMFKAGLVYSLLLGATFETMTFLFLKLSLKESYSDHFAAVGMYFCFFLYIATDVFKPDSDRKATLIKMAIGHAVYSFFSCVQAFIHRGVSQELRLICLAICFATQGLFWAVISKLPEEEQQQQQPDDEDKAEPAGRPSPWIKWPLVGLLGVAITNDVVLIVLKAGKFLMADIDDEVVELVLYGAFLVACFLPTNGRLQRGYLFLNVTYHLLYTFTIIVEVIYNFLRVQRDLALLSTLLSLLICLSVELLIWMFICEVIGGGVSPKKDEATSGSSASVSSTSQQNAV